jgi:hypothetical protein
MLEQLQQSVQQWRHVLCERWSRVVGGWFTACRIATRGKGSSSSSNRLKALPAMCVQGGT